jgi:hypothetical protein
MIYSSGRLKLAVLQLSYAEANTNEINEVSLRGAERGSNPE